MCDNPVYILHPTLKTIGLKHNFKYIVDCYGQICRNISRGWFSDLKQCFNEIRKGTDLRKLTCSQILSYNVVDDSNNHHPLFFAAPCGYCKKCRYNRVSEYSNRAYLEYLDTGIPPIFVTLTYDDNHLPSDGVNRKDITRFLNRLYIEFRKSEILKIDNRIRALVVSEYGSDSRFTRRPHYHLLLFGIPLNLADYISLVEFDRILRASWIAPKQKGVSYNPKPFHSHIVNAVHMIAGEPLCTIIDWSVARNPRATCRYCVKYLLKSDYDNVPEGKNRNFISTPHVGGSLGTGYFQSHFNDFLNCLYSNTDLCVVDPRGRAVSLVLPNLFRKKILRSLSSYGVLPALKLLHLAFTVAWHNERFDFCSTLLHDYPFANRLCDYVSPKYFLNSRLSSPDKSFKWYCNSFIDSRTLDTFLQGCYNLIKIQLQGLTKSFFDSIFAVQYFTNVYINNQIELSYDDFNPTCCRERTTRFQLYGY